eukprot:663547-Pelagomonas_calceolata.AAC.3
MRTQRRAWHLVKGTAVHPGTLIACKPKLSVKRMHAQPATRTVSCGPACSHTQPLPAAPPREPRSLCCSAAHCAPHCLLHSCLQAHSHCQLHPHESPGVPAFVLFSCWLVLPGSCLQDLAHLTTTATRTNNNYNSTAGSRAAFSVAAAAGGDREGSHAAATRGGQGCNAASQGSQGSGAVRKECSKQQALRWRVAGAMRAEEGELLLLATGVCAYVPRRVVLRDVCVCVELGGCVRCWGICCCCCCYSCCLPVLERSYRLVLAANAAHVRMHASGERLPHVRGGRDATAAAAAAGLMSMFLGTC